MSGSTTGVYTFSYDDWIGAFPEFRQTVTSPQATIYFGMAVGTVDNTPTSVIPLTDAGGNPIRGPILELTTAHYAQILAGSSQQDAGALVGRISDVTEGSVSVGTDLQVPGSAGWWAQTKYGLMAWQMQAPFRVGRYFAPPTVPLAAQSFPFFPFAFPGVVR